MDINFKTLQMGFIAYLQEILEKEGNQEEISELSAISIFQYQDEFKQYVSEKLHIDESEIPADFTELMNLEFENGQFSMPSGEEATNFSDEELAMFDIMTGVVNNILADEDVISALDGDKSGMIDEEEMKSFLEFMSNQDGDGDNLSIKDILSTMEQIKEGNYNVESVSLSKVDNSQTNNDTSISPSSGSSGGGGGGYNYTPTTVKEPEVSKYKTMDLATLSSEKSQKESDISDAYEALSSVYSGQNEKVQEAQANLEEKETAYVDAVDKDEKISQSLKDEQKANLKEINDEESTQDNLNSQLSSVMSQMSSKKSEISAISSNISALETSLATLSSQSSDDEEIQASIEAQKAAVEEKLAVAKQNLEQAKSELSDLESQEKSLGSQMKESEERMTELETQRANIDLRISESASTDLSQFQSDYNTAKANLTTVKDNEAIISLQNINAIQTELDEINKFYNEKTAKETRKEHRVDTGDMFSDLFEYNTEYIDDENNLPYLLIGPENADPNEELPVLVYLHGLGEVGGGESEMRSVGPGKFMPEWDLENFNGYVICPVIPNGRWENPTREQEIRNILTDFENVHNYKINHDKVAIAGHSAGGMGALYMAKHMDDVFSSAAILSGYNVDIPMSEINIPIIGYVGNNEDQVPMDYLFNKQMGNEYLITVEADHGGVPGKVLQRDSDGNGRSDFFEFLFGDKDVDDMK